MHLIMFYSRIINIINERERLPMNLTLEMWMSTIEKKSIH
jgi:hypothetical protein